jgi:hypothetical protein
MKGLLMILFSYAVLYLWLSLQLMKNHNLFTEVSTWLKSTASDFIIQFCGGTLLYLILLHLIWQEFRYGKTVLHYDRPNIESGQGHLT